MSGSELHFLLICNAMYLNAYYFRESNHICKQSLGLNLAYYQIVLSSGIKIQVLWGPSMWVILEEKSDKIYPTWSYLLVDCSDGRTDFR